ncbi:MAG TPA: carboxypeptidase regulatory-like domain-containing protein, partial [Vicinamibacteria bacterium]|nr:carboxypeptidase regulatory-like domain-containing protein [Vicinamibacteria bacterium]
MRKGYALLVPLLVLALASPALAQRSTGTIRGTVTDETGAVIAGAKATVRNEGTGLTRTGTTNNSGVYVFADLPVGSYEVRVEQDGFKAAVQKGIVLNVAESQAVDVELATGGITEEVVVEAAGTGVQTIGGDVSGLVTGEEARELPLNGRNFMQLTLLMPGVSAPETGLSLKDKGLLGGSDLSVSGSGVTSNLWLVDGANNNDVGSNRTILIYPSVDAIEEFKIHRNSYGAEFGQAAGAQVNIVTRSGTNEFHGSAFYFGRNDALNARSYFLEKADKPKENLSRHDFGYTFSGPIVKDRVHFFAAQEWNREQRGTVRAFQVPTAAERRGDFSSPVPGCSGTAPIDPLTGLPFAGGIIPANRLSPAGLLYLQLFPEPNTTPTSGCNNWVTSLDTPINWRQDSLRVDWSVTDSTRVMVRYTQNAWDNNSPIKWDSYWGDDPFPAVDSNWDQPGRSLVMQLNHNIGSNAMNTLQFSYSANKLVTTRGGDNPGLNEQINAAIPSIADPGLKPFGNERSHPIFWGGLGYGQNLWNQAPFSNNQDLFVIKDDYSAVFGKHSVKVGALFSFNKKNEEGGGGFDSVQFWGPTGLNGWGGNTGNVLADFLLRDMAFGFSEFATNPTSHQRWRDLEFYAADSWKVHSRVTLDLGLRVSNYYNPYNSDDRITSFNPDAFDPALGNDPCNGLMQAPGKNFCQEAGFEGGTAGPNRSLYDNATGLIAPRLGVAWDLFGDGRTALRAGLGRFFTRERLGPSLSLAFQNPPFNQLLSGTRLLDTAAEPCDGCFAVGDGAPKMGRALDGGQNPNNWQWNLTWEQQLLKNTTFELSYVGNRGLNLLRVRDINQVPNADRNGNGVNDRLDYVRAGEDQAAKAALRPFGVFGDSVIQFWDHTGKSIYHSLQTQVVSHFGTNSLFQASYTWSRLIADDPLNDSSGTAQRETTISDNTNNGLDRQLAAVHRAHIFNASAVLGLPSLEGKGSFAQNVFGDWQIASIVQYASGVPLSVYVGSLPGVRNGAGGTGYND